MLKNGNLTYLRQKKNTISIPLIERLPQWFKTIHALTMGQPQAGVDVGSGENGPRPLLLHILAKSYTLVIINIITYVEVKKVSILMDGSLVMLCMC